MSRTSKPKPDKPLFPGQRDELRTVLPMNRWPARRGLRRSPPRQRSPPPPPPGDAPPARAPSPHCTWGAPTPATHSPRSPKLPRPEGLRCPSAFMAPGFHRASRGLGTGGEALGKARASFRSFVPRAGTPAGPPSAWPPVPVCRSTQAPKLLVAAEWPGRGDAADLPTSNHRPKCEVLERPRPSGTN